MRNRVAALLLLLACDGTVGQTGPDAGVDAIAPADAGASPLSSVVTVADFGCVPLGQAVAYSVPIANDGAAPLGPIFAELLPSSDTLLILNNGCADLTLAPNEACIVSIFFKPSVPIDIEATLDVMSQGFILRVPVRAHGRSGC